MRYVDRRDDINDILNQLFILFKVERVINPGVNSGALEELAVPAPLVAFVMLI
jgi:hypothetical protein